MLVGLYDLNESERVINAWPGKQYIKGDHYIVGITNTYAPKRVKSTQVQDH